MQTSRLAWLQPPSRHGGDTGGPGPTNWEGSSSPRMVGLRCGNMPHSPWQMLVTSSREHEPLRTTCGGPGVHDRAAGRLRLGCARRHFRDRERHRRGRPTSPHRARHGHASRGALRLAGAGADGRPRRLLVSHGASRRLLAHGRHIRLSAGHAAAARPVRHRHIARARAARRRCVRDGQRERGPADDQLADLDDPEPGHAGRDWRRARRDAHQQFGGRDPVRSGRLPGARPAAHPRRPPGVVARRRRAGAEYEHRVERGAPVRSEGHRHD